MRAPTEFSLVKWYIDVTDADGRAAIAYHARLRWQRVALTYQSVVRYSADGTRDARRSMRSGVGPRRERDSVTWSSRPLALLAQATGRAAPIEVDLWNGVHWCCHAPVADVTMECDGSTLTGPGYVECLSMTVPPWALPIAELRWGRWSDDEHRHALVWIDWQDADPGGSCHWVFLDGNRVEARVDDDGVASDAFDLALHKRRTLEQRSLSTLGRGLPRLLTVLPPAVRRMREEKWLSSGTFRRRTLPGHAISGTSIHEVVTFL